VILVFVNMLARCQPDGTDDRHWRAIADETGLGHDRVKAAIAVLEAPDAESRSPEHEGRRLVKIDERRAWGWRIVNFVAYRGYKDEEHRRAMNAHYQRKHRQHLSAPVSNGQEVSCKEEAEAEAKTETYPPTPKGAEGVYALSNAPSNAPSMVPDNEGETPTKPKRARKKKEPEEYTDDFCRFWDAYPRKANKRYAWESWQGALDRPPLDRILFAVEMQSRQDSWQKDGGQYIPHPSTWLNRGGWDDVPLQSRVAHSLAGG
jgi:hypothetical protein